MKSARSGVLTPPSLCALRLSRPEPRAPHRTSDSAVASISNAAGSRGLATSIAQGTAEISAMMGSIAAAPIALVIAPPAAVAIIVLPASPSIALGTTRQFVGSLVYSDNSTAGATDQLTWTSSDETVAFVHNSGLRGLAAGISIGSATITASAPGLPAGSATLTVTPAILTSLMVRPEAVTIGNGEQGHFSAFGTYSDGFTQDLRRGQLSTSTIQSAETHESYTTRLSARHLPQLMDGSDARAAMPAQKIAQLPNALLDPCHC